MMKQGEVTPKQNGEPPNSLPPILVVRNKKTVEKPLERVEDENTYPLGGERELDNVAVHLINVENPDQRKEESKRLVEISSGDLEVVSPELLERGERISTMMGAFATQSVLGTVGSMGAILQDLKPEELPASGELSQNDKLTQLGSCVKRMSSTIREFMSVAGGKHEGSSTLFKPSVDETSVEDGRTDRKSDDLLEHDIDLTRSIDTMDAHLKACSDLEHKRRRDMMEDYIWKRNKVESVKELEEMERNYEFARSVAGIFHDMNNKLSVIVGYSDIATFAGLESESIENMKGAQKDMSGLILDMVEKENRFKAGEELSTQEIIEANITELAKDSVKDVETLIPETEVELSIEDDTVIQASNKLDRALHNMVVNAGNELEITDKQRRLGITVSKQGGHAIIEIANTGRKIDPEIMPKIFDDWFTTKREGGYKSGGSGIGLETCKRIVEFSGGHIIVESGKHRYSTKTRELTEMEEEFDAKYDTVFRIVLPEER